MSCYKMVHDPPSAILVTYFKRYLVRSFCESFFMFFPETGAVNITWEGAAPPSTFLTIATVSATSGKFMVDSLEWMTVSLTVTSKEVLRPSLAEIK